jgi:predicted ribosome quality control (RQC) complex YloA/Tae2 family protein
MKGDIPKMEKHLVQIEEDLNKVEEELEKLQGKENRIREYAEKIGEIIDSWEKGTKYELDEDDMRPDPMNYGERDD